MQSETYDDVPPPFDELDVATLKLPPHSLEAEQSVLGGLLIRGEAWDTVADLVTESDFFQPRHRHIYAKMAALVDAERQIAKLQRHKQLKLHHRKQQRQLNKQLSRQ